MPNLAIHPANACRFAGFNFRKPHSQVAYLLCFLALTVSNALAQQPFTIVALPDTQNYVNSSSNTAFFGQQTQWIAGQIQTDGNPRNIQFVTHLGDMVSSGDSLLQLQRADAAMDTLDGVIEYSVLPGNHDYADTGVKSTGTDDYLGFFGPQRFAGASWFGGSDPSGNNSYQRFSAGGYDFIHLALEWQPSSNVPFRETSPVEWAQSVLDANPNTPVILSTHEHIDDDPPGRSGTGQALWDQLISHNDQIFMVLNGHFHSVGGTNDGEYHQVSLNQADRPVFEVLQDYQDYPNGGDGWLRLIEFDVANDQIRFETYSPVLDQFQTERVEDVGNYASEFEFDIDFADRLSPVFIPPPDPPAVPDIVIRNGLDGYVGTSDKELRFSGGDSGNGQDDSISVDGDDGNPGSQPNHGLIGFADIIGDAAGQLPADAEVEQAILTLEVFNQGSGFSVHEMLVPWSETSTWQSLGSGVQANDVEAQSTPIATLGANNGSSNVPSGTLEIDVTTSIQAYQSGTLENHGWALLPFTDGTNGVDFYTSEIGDPGLRPSLQIFLVDDSLAGDYNGDGEVNLADYTVWRDALGSTGAGLAADGDGSGTIDEVDYQIWRNNFGNSEVATTSIALVPEPSGLCWQLSCVATCIGLLIRRRSRPRSSWSDGQ